MADGGTRMPAPGHLDELAAVSKGAVFSEIARRRHAKRVRGRVLAIACAAVVIAGTFVASPAIQGLGPADAPSTTALSIPAPTAAVDALAVTVTCSGAGPFDLRFEGGVSDDRTGTCTSAGQTRVLEFSVSGEPATSTLAVGDRAVDGGLTVAMSYLYAAPVPYSVNIDDGGGTELSQGGADSAAGGPQSEGTPTPGSDSPGSDDGISSLVPAVGTGPAGESVDGFVRAQDVQPPAAIFLDPVDTQAWFDAFRSAYPTGQAISLYEADGITRLGTFLLTH